MAANAAANKIISVQNKRDIKKALESVERDLQAQQTSDPSLGILLEFRFRGGADSGEGPTAEARFDGLSWARPQRVRGAGKVHVRRCVGDRPVTWIPPLAPESDWEDGGLAKFADVTKVEFVRLEFAQVGGFR